MRMKRQRKLVVCVSIAGAHCLKIKGLRSKALTTAVWLLHVLGHNTQILLWSLEIYKPAKICAKHFSSKTLSFCNMGFLFLLVTDHVNWRCGENPGWDPGVNWISKGKCLLGVSHVHLHRAISTIKTVLYSYLQYCIFLYCA